MCRLNSTAFSDLRRRCQKLKRTCTPFASIPIKRQEGYADAHRDRLTEVALVDHATNATSVSCVIDTQLTGRSKSVLGPSQEPRIAKLVEDMPFSGVLTGVL